MAKLNPIELQKHLKGVDYPVGKKELVKYAKEQGADKDALSVLEQLPDDQYESPADVSKAVGESE